MRASVTTTGRTSWSRCRQRMSISGLRIDFLSALTTIEIAAITVESTKGELVYQAKRASEFQSIKLLGDCLGRSLDPFKIEVTGVDPQLHLPSFPRTARGSWS